MSRLLLLTEPQDPSIFRGIWFETPTGDARFQDQKWSLAEIDFF